MRIGLLLLLWGLLTGCEEPIAHFVPFTLPRPVDMTRVLGPAPVLLGPQDTLALRLHFNAATGFTDFSLANDSATQSWFTARAFRFKGLYYLVEEQPDAGYRIHAVRIGRGQVQGLGTGYRQMRVLSEAAWQGRWPQLLAPNGDSLHLRFDRHLLRAFYKTQVDNFMPYRLAAEPVAATSLAHSGTMTTATSLYPNPASTTATVTFGGAGAHEVRLYNTRGQLLHFYPAITPQLILPVAHLANGSYLLRVNQAGKSQPATLRMIVAH